MKVHFGRSLLASLVLIGCGPIADEDNASVINEPRTIVDVMTKISNAEEIGEIVKTEKIKISFETTFSGDTAEVWEVTGYQCGVDALDLQPCEQEVILDELRHGGEYIFTTRAVLKNLEDESEGVAMADVIRFTVQIADGDDVDPVDPAQPVKSALAKNVQIGDFYLATVPEDMHITEYSTSKTTGVLSFYRILNSSDPYYLGNFQCNRDWDAKVVGISPAGESLEYCHSTPTRAAYRQSNEHRLANNHIEVATNANLVAKTNHERLSVSVYDRDYEFMTTRSRFANLCMNRPVDYIDVPMLDNFFLGTTPEVVRFWFCETTLPAKDGSVEHWQIGTFIEADDFDWECDSCLYPRAVEMVYMTRPDQSLLQPSYFARQAQGRVLDFLSKVAP